jgi:chromate reductase
MLPANIQFQVYDGIGTLPHFNDAAAPSAEVLEFRKKVKEANGVIICTPEYAFGIPGSLKNALDWTVGTAEFVDKPVALITAASHGLKAHAAMLLVLQAISANVIADSSMIISFVRAKLDEHGNVKDLETLEALKTAMKIFTKHL